MKRLMLRYNVLYCGSNFIVLTFFNNTLENGDNLELSTGDYSPYVSIVYIYGIILFIMVCT